MYDERHKHWIITHVMNNQTGTDIYLNIHSIRHMTDFGIQITNIFCTYLCMNTLNFM